VKPRSSGTATRPTFLRKFGFSSYHVFVGKLSRFAQGGELHWGRKAAAESGVIDEMAGEGWLISQNALAALLRQMPSPV
jgi:hypothetical protein